jgi:hypothetical protein
MKLYFYFTPVEPNRHEIYYQESFFHQNEWLADAG